MPTLFLERKVCHPLMAHSVLIVKLHKYISSLGFCIETQSISKLGRFIINTMEYSRMVLMIVLFCVSVTTLATITQEDHLPTSEVDAVPIRIPRCCKICPCTRSIPPRCLCRRPPKPKSDENGF